MVYSGSSSSSSSNSSSKQNPYNKKNMQRINVVGVTGSGKSTFSKKLADVLTVRNNNQNDDTNMMMMAVPCIEMDELFWKPNWTETPKEEFCDLLEQTLNDAGDRWVLDGNYHNATVPIKWKLCDTVIWIDYGFWRTLFQSIQRALWRSWTQIEIWPGSGCRETFYQLFFSTDSIVWWTITMYRKVKVRYETAMMANNGSCKEEYPHLKFVRLRSPYESEQFLKSLVQDKR